jgi:hypothetical protein
LLFDLCSKGIFFPVNTFFSEFDEIMVFDSFKNLPLNEEKARFDNLFHTITNDKTLISFIEFRLNKNESRKRKMDRFKAISKHFDSRKVDKSRFTLVFIEDEEERTTIWVQPQDAKFVPLLIEKTESYYLVKADKLKERINELFPNK